MSKTVSTLYLTYAAAAFSVGDELTYKLLDYVASPLAMYVPMR